MIPTATRALALAAFVLCAPATAQERFTALVEGVLDPPVVVDVELEAGCVTDLRETDLAPLTPISIATSWGVARVGGRLWLATDEGILRYDEVGGAARYAFVDHLQPGTRYLDVFAVPAGALAMRVDAATSASFVEQFDVNGNLVQSFPVGVVFRSFVPYQSGYLGVVGNSRIDVLDASFNAIGPFAPGAQQAAAAAGTNYLPDSLTVLSDGRIVISASVSIVITDPTGSVFSVADVGFLEGGALETGGGLLVVPSADGVRLLDPDTLDVFDVGGALDVELSFRLSAASPSALPTISARACAGSPNSTGAGARVHLLGVDDTAERTLSAIGTRLPPGTFALPIFGTAAFNGPYGDGRLCVSPLAPGITRGAVAAASAAGAVQSTFDFLSPQSGAAFLPGTTWHFQFVYRDGGGTAGFNGTDGVSISFRP